MADEQLARAESEGGDEIINSVLSKSASSKVHVVHCHRSYASGPDVSNSHYNLHRGSGESLQDSLQSTTLSNGDRLFLLDLLLPTTNSLEKSLLGIPKAVQDLAQAMTHTPKEEAKLKLNTLKKLKRAASLDGHGGGGSKVHHNQASLRSKWKHLTKGTGWLNAVKAYLKGAQKVAQLVSMGDSVVVQNDEGRDAVTVVVSLVQVPVPPRPYVPCSPLVKHTYLAFPGRSCSIHFFALCKGSPFSWKRSGTPLVTLPFHLPIGLAPC